MTSQTLSPPKSASKIPRSERVPQEQLLSITSPPGLASILIPCCGQLEYTKLCVPSLLKYTRQPYELIFLDVGSLDGTADYLAGVAAAAQVRIIVVRTLTDLGVAQAVQDTLKQARGEYIVILNNDTIVSEGWLNQLVGLAQLTPAVGLVGPMSNVALPPQKVENVPYRIGPRKRASDGHSGGEWLVDVNAVEEFARKWREENRGKWQEAERLGGFCLLIKRGVLERIGPLEKWTELAYFDNVLLSSKARQAGYTLACCRDLYIHHFGTRTFAHGAPKTDSHESNP